MPYNNMNQLQVYVPSLLDILFTSHHIPLIWVVIEPWFNFPESYSKFRLDLYLHIVVYVSMLLSPFVSSCYGLKCALSPSNSHVEPLTTNVSVFNYKVFNEGITIKW